MAASNEEVIQLLTTAYSMEIETVMNYLANSINLDGVRAEEIKKSLAADVPAELGHAQQLGPPDQAGWRPAAGLAWA